MKHLESKDIVKFIDGTVIITTEGYLNNCSFFCLWGLGKDGNLYCNCSALSSLWCQYNDLKGQIFVSFSEMRNIVKAFNLLLPFI